MSKDGVTLLHASDLHLDQTLYGAAHVPDHHLQLFASASLDAARRVFDLAIDHQVDALLLAGDVVDLARAGGAQLEFLCRQFSRLEQHQIAVVWLAGRAEARGHWPRGVAPPANVHRIGGPEPQLVPIRRGTTTVATVVAACPGADADLSAADWQLGEGDLPRIALAYGRISAEAAATLPADYVALGGRHRRRRLHRAAPTAHYSGSPQGFSPREPGAHGCCLVTIPLDRHTRCRFLPTDAARWQVAELDVTAATTPADVLHRLQSAVGALRQPSPPPVTLVRWRLQAGEALGRLLRQDDVRRKLLAALAAPPTAADRVVSSEIDVLSQETLGDSSAEDSLLGDFLRTAEQFRAQGHIPLDVPAALEAHPQAELLGHLVKTTSPIYQQQLWDTVIAQGCDRLRG